MPRGRKPTPTRLKLLRGNPGGRPLNAGEPRPPAAIPDCPDHLAGEAAAEWQRITAELAGLGLLTQCDRAALAAYCGCWARWIKAEDVLARSGEVLKAPERTEVRKDGTTVTTSGGFYQNPWLAVANRALELMHKYLTEFGLTPASRTRVKGDAPAGDALDQFLAG